MFGRILGHAQDVVAERLASATMNEDKQDMLGSFVRHGLDQVQLECETILIIVAGADPAATAL